MELRELPTVDQSTLMPFLEKVWPAALLLEHIYLVNRLSAMKELLTKGNFVIRERKILAPPTPTSSPNSLT